MQTTKSYSNQRQPGREHFPLYPKGFIALRIVQLVLAVVVIGLTGFGVTYAAFSEVALLLFTVRKTHLHWQSPLLTLLRE